MKMPSIQSLLLHGMPILLLSSILSHSSSAQTPALSEVECLGAGQEGALRLKAWGEGGNTEDAVAQAVRNAFNSVLFKGIASGSVGCPLSPLVPEGRAKNAVYFDKFFSEDGRYIDFVELTGGGNINPEDRIKVGRKYKIGVYLVMRHRELQTELQEGGVIQKMVAPGKKPLALVIPADIYCMRKGFFAEVGANDTREKVPDYKRLFQDANGVEMRNLIATMNAFASKKDFDFVDLEQILKDIPHEKLIKSELKDKDGKSIRQSPLDVIKEAGKPDIILDLDFEFKKNGPEQYLSLTLKGLDAYTNKQIASCPILGKPSINASVDVLLLENNYTRMTEFTTDLQKHFNNLKVNGREVTFKFVISEGATVDLDTEFGDAALSEVLESWLDELCVNSSYNATKSTENMMNVRQARIRIVNEKNKPLDAEDFLQTFQKRLKAPPYNLSCNIDDQGLGEAWLIIGSTKPNKE